METNYEINYEDQRFQDVEADKQTALNEVDVTYGNMIDQADKYYQQQIDASKEWADKQTQLQQEQTDFAIQEIEQNKEQTHKDYLKEQSGAYVDWQKQSNKYGTEAEQNASVGMTGTGYSESSQVSMYNTYQNRVATARESYTRAVQDYDNAITQARLQNSSVLAEIAYSTLQQQLELSLQGFQYKNQLLLEQANRKLEVDQTYYARYQDVLQQINYENSLAEQIRQFNEQMALKTSGGGGGGGYSASALIADNSSDDGTMKKVGGSLNSYASALGYSSNSGTGGTVKEQATSAVASKNTKSVNAQSKTASTVNASNAAKVASSTAGKSTKNYVTEEVEKYRK